MSYKIKSPIPVVEGGSGVQTITSYAVVCGGTVPTGPVQPIASVGTAGQGLTSNGAGALPTFQDTAMTTYRVVNTTPYVVLATDSYIAVNCTAAPITIQLPDVAVLGKSYTIKDLNGDSATNNITVTTVTGATNIDGNSTYTINTSYQAINIMGGFGAAWEIY